MEKEHPEKENNDLEQLEMENQGAIDNFNRQRTSQVPWTVAPKDPQRFKVVFSGTAGEYFRIWIVNLFLTVLTLGIYAAWARVRTRRYFHAHTLLAGQSFDYMANPWFILKGNLIIAAGFLLYLFAESYNPLYSSIVLIVFYLVLPFLIYKSLRFNAYNTAYRNIRFRFLGSLKESYKTYLLVPILIPLTLGLIVPYWMFRRKKYFFKNFCYGAATNSFKGASGPFYRAYGMAGLLSVGLSILFFAGIFGFGSMGKNLSIDSGSLNKSLILIPAASSLFIFAFFTFIQQYIFTRVTNYCWSRTSLESLHFQSSLVARKLFWIRLSNILAIFISFGLLIPWAKVRRARYILNRLIVIADTGLDDFTAAAETDQGAIGEAATSFFDIEIGL